MVIGGSRGGRLSGGDMYVYRESGERVAGSGEVDIAAP